MHVIIDLSTAGCVVSEKNSRSSSRSLGQSPKSSKACPCCVDTSPAVRKRLADHLSDDNETAPVECKRMRRSLDASRRLASTSRASDAQVIEVLDAAGKVQKTVVGASGSNAAAEVVKRGRGRPRKVSSSLSIVSVRCNIYILRLCYDASVRLSVHLSVMFVHCGHRVQ